MVNNTQPDKDSPQPTIVAHICTSESMHPYECDGKGKCRHCDRAEQEGHNPQTCALCNWDATEIDIPAVFTVMGPKHRVILREDTVVVLSCDPKTPEKVIGSGNAFGRHLSAAAYRCDTCNGYVFVPEHVNE